MVNGVNSLLLFSATLLAENCREKEAVNDERKYDPDAVTAHDRPPLAPPIIAF